MTPRWFRLLLKLRRIVCLVRGHRPGRLTEYRGQTVAIRQVCLRCSTVAATDVTSGKFPTPRGVPPTIEKAA